MRTILLITISFYVLGGNLAIANGITLPEDPIQLSKDIQTRIPVGMPIDEAQKKLEQLGFKCEPGRLINDFGPASTTSYINCEHREMGKLHRGRIKRWQVAVAYIDGKVSETKAVFDHIRTK